MIFVVVNESPAMSTKNSTSSTSTILIVLLLIFTFPLWIGLFGVLIGLIGGAFGIVVGVLGAVFGAVVAVISLPFRFIFGGADWGFDCPVIFSGLHFNKYTFLALIIVAALVLQRRGRKVS